MATVTAKTAPRDTTALADTLQRLVDDYDLAFGLKPGCYALERDSAAPPVSVTVREVHTPACGGDPQTAPRLSSFRWEPATGRLITDRWGLAEGRKDTVLR
jgi:hypothetical protein